MKVLKLGLRDVAFLLFMAAMLALIIVLNVLLGAAI